MLIARFFPPKPGVLAGKHFGGKILAGKYEKCTLLVFSCQNVFPPKAASYKNFGRK